MALFDKKTGTGNPFAVFWREEDTIKYQLKDCPLDPLDRSIEVFAAVKSIIDFYATKVSRPSGSNASMPQINSFALNALAGIDSLLKGGVNLNMTDGERDFLTNYWNVLTEIQSNDLYRKAFADLITVAASTQAIAISSPLIGTGIGAATDNPSLGGAITGAIYTVAPAPGALWIMLRRKSYKNQFASVQDGSKFILSLLTMMIPFVGNVAAFPVSLVMQDERDYFNFIRIMNKHLVDGKIIKRISDIASRIISRTTTHFD